MIVKDKITVEDKGSEVKVSQKIVTNNMDLMQFAAMMRSLPEEQRKCFWRQCRVKAVIPMYLPKGMFRENEHFGHLLRDPDKQAFFHREAPEFNTVHDPLAPKPRIVTHA